jgi:hypothetical protein
MRGGTPPMENTLTVFGLRIGLLSLPPPCRLLQIRWCRMNQLRQACGQQEMCTLPERYDVGSDKEHEANSSPSPPNLKPSSHLHYAATPQGGRVSRRFEIRPPREDRHPVRLSHQNPRSCSSA